MAFTYFNQPKKRAIDAIRLEIGDTIEGTHLIEDEEIEYALDQEDNNNLRAAARLAENLAARYAREENVRHSGFSIEKGGIYKKYKELAKDLREKSGHGSADFIMNLTDKAKHDNNRQSTTIIQPAFRRGMHSYNRYTKAVGPLSFETKDEES